MRRALLLSCLLAAACGGDEEAEPVAGAGGSAPTQQCVEIEARWAESFGGVGRVELHEAAVDADGELLLAGAFGEELNFGGELVTADVTDGFVAKLHAGGAAGEAPVWRAHVAGTESERVHAVTNLPAGGAVVAGYYDADLSVDDSSLSSTDASNDAYLGVLTPEGSVSWLASFGDLANQRGGQHLAVDAAGNIALFGTFREGVLDFGGGVSVSSPADGRYSVVAASFDAAGQPRWARTYGDVDENAFGMAGLVVDEAGNLYITGAFDSTLPALFGEMPAQGAVDSFVAKLDNQGNVLWSSLISGEFPGLAEVRDIALVDDAVVVTGLAAGVLWTEGAVQASDGLSDVFFVSMSADDGGFRTMRMFGGEGLSSGVALEPLHDPATGTTAVALAGRFERGVDIGCAQSDEHTGMFVSVLEPQLGSLLGGVIFPGLFGHLELVTAGPDLLLAGEFRGEADVSTIQLNSSDSFATDILVAALPLPELP